MQRRNIKSQPPHLTREEVDLRLEEREMQEANVLIDGKRGSASLERQEEFGWKKEREYICASTNGAKFNR